MPVYNCGREVHNTIRAGGSSFLSVRVRSIATPRAAMTLADIPDMYPAGCRLWVSLQIFAGNCDHQESAMVYTCHVEEHPHRKLLHVLTASVRMPDISCLLTVNFDRSVSSR